MFIIIALPQGRMMSGGLGMVCWFVGVLLLYGYVVGMKNGHWVVLFFRKGWLIEEDRACPVPTHYTGMGL